MISTFIDVFVLLLRGANRRVSKGEGPGASAAILRDAVRARLLRMRIAGGSCADHAAALVDIAVEIGREPVRRRAMRAYSARCSSSAA